MANVRDRIQMSDDELREFLDGERVLQVASLGSDGWPHLVPMWFAVDDEGRIVFSTYRTSQKIRNLERDPRVTLLVEGGTAYQELRGAMIKGDAELLDDVEATLDVMRLVNAKYYGGQASDERDRERHERRRRAAHKRIGVRVHPRQISSWDHSKLQEG